MKRTVAAVLLLASASLAHADWIDSLLASLRARVPAGPSARYTGTTNRTVGLLTYPPRDTRSAARPVKGKIIAIAVSGAGDVSGQVLRPVSGRVVCEFSGLYDGTCLTLAGCVSGTRCD